MTAPINTRLDLGSLAAKGALWASAAVIAGLIIVQASRMPGDGAYAEMVSSVGEYTVLTTDGGNEEVLLVLDNRNEDLLVYKVKAQKELELFQKVDLDKLFIDARASARSRP